MGTVGILWDAFEILLGYFWNTFEILLGFVLVLFFTSWSLLVLLCTCWNFEPIFGNFGTLGVFLGTSGYFFVLLGIFCTLGVS